MYCPIKKIRLLFVQDKKGTQSSFGQLNLLRWQLVRGP